MVAGGHMYEEGLGRNAANFQPLTPLTFLARGASVYPDQTAIIHGPLRRDYATFYARSRRLASALSRLGVKRGDTVSRGQVVAKSGQSGNVSSPQLHFELRKGSTPVDPTPYLNN